MSRREINAKVTSNKCQGNSDRECGGHYDHEWRYNISILIW